MNSLKPAWFEVTIETGTKFILDPVDEAEKVEQAINAGWIVKPLYYAPAQNQWQNLTNDEANELIQRWSGELIFEVTQKLKDKNNGKS